MKKTPRNSIRKIAALFVVLTMLASMLSMGTITVSAAPDEPIVFTKTLVPATTSMPERIKLEAYVTGSATASQVSVPTDIVLVLDQSGSMDYDMSSTDSTSRLEAMRTAVRGFVTEVAEFERANNNDYRVAIVGFSSESGYNNTELLTVETTEQILGYVRLEDVTGMDENKTYYIYTGDGYQSITYQDFLFREGWYTSGLFGSEINIQSTIIYERVVTGTTPATVAVQYADATTANYEAALVDCIPAAVEDGGYIDNAIDRLDAEGATRVDLGMEMAQKIFDAQGTGFYENRRRIVMVLTDGVPTTSSDFSPSVANAAVSYAKELKDDGVRIFSTYLGTPDADSQSFLQALSSNYPDATEYNVLGTQVASSYYKANADASGITSFFEELVYDISANATLNEQSVTTDTISRYFKLPVIEDGIANTEQITCYTVDKITDTALNALTDTDWGEEVPFPVAKVTIGEDNKTVSITGFNFGYHCVTEDAKDDPDGDGPEEGTNYGRKLVVYIPIIEDAEVNTFGGWLPTNDDAEIFKSSSATSAEITAPSQHSDVTKRYSMENAVFTKHIDDQTEYDFNYNPATLNSLLAKMIPYSEDPSINKVPDGENNKGVTMTYKLIDTQLTNPDETDDDFIATITVPAGQNAVGTVYDPRNFENWDWIEPSAWTTSDETEKNKTFTITANNLVQGMYALECTLVNSNNEEVTDLNPLKEYGLLSVNIANSTFHIVGGVIDRGGTISAVPDTQGIIAGDTYGERVQEGFDSATMIFTPKTGYEISRIVIKTKHDGDVDFASNEIYNIEKNINTENIIFGADGKYEKGFTSVEGASTVEVYTRLKSFALTTAVDVGKTDIGAAIRPSTTYTWSDEALPVYFTARTGYKIEKVKIGETEETATEYTAAQILNGDATAQGLALADVDTALDHNNQTIIVGGDVRVSRQQNNYVEVTSSKRSFKVTYKYYKPDGTGSYITDIADEIYAVAYGDPVTQPVADDKKLGAEKIIDGANHTLKGWYSTYTGTAFSDITDVSALTMGAQDLVFYGCWEKNPNIIISPKPKLKKIIYNQIGNPEAYGTAIDVNIVAVFREQIVGRATIPIAADQYENSAPVEIDITLTDIQHDAYLTKTVPIYLYEVHQNSPMWIYDDERYELYYAGTNNDHTDNGVVTIKTRDGATVDQMVNTDGVYVNGNLLFENAQAPYIVRYNLNGGLLNGVARRSPQIVEFEQDNLTQIGAPSKEGYTFTGWKMNEITVSDEHSYSDLVNGDKTQTSIILVAQYRENSSGGGGGTKQYTLTFESNGGTKFSPEKHNSGKVVKLDKIPEKDGYIFDGWHLDETLNEDTAEVRMTKNITVYADWIEDDGHDLSNILNKNDHFAYIVGYPDGKVKPNAIITRAEVATIFFRMMTDDSRTVFSKNENPFSDVDKSDWFNMAISTLHNAKILDGYLDGTFRPDEPITRAELSKIAASFYKAQADETVNFSDISGHWAEKFIESAHSYGFINGYPDGTFKPDQAITRAETMKIVNATLERAAHKDYLLDDMIKWPDNADTNEWYYADVQEATNSHNYSKNTSYEVWTELRAVRDWAALEITE